MYNINNTEPCDIDEAQHIIMGGCPECFALINESGEYHDSWCRHRLKWEWDTDQWEQFLAAIK